MAIILSIDTSVETAHVSINENDSVIAKISNPEPKNHGSFIQPAIAELLNKVGIQFSQIDAIAVANGPGSYTGLRVGLATAKGICFALNKPLIALNTLHIMALAIKTAILDINYIDLEYYRFCPMIDARRLEVFTAIYDANMEIMVAPCPLILTSESFSEIIGPYTVVFSGSGAPKFRAMILNDNAVFVDEVDTVTAMASIAYQYYTASKTADVNYLEPYYLKDFHFAEKKSVPNVAAV